MSAAGKPTVTARPATPAWRRWLPVGVLLVAVLLFFALGLGRYLSLEALREHRSVLRAWVDTSGVLAGLIFMAVYIVAVACSLPGATILTVTSGFLFGPLWGTGLVVISATTGAALLFRLAQGTLGQSLRGRAGAWLPRLEAGFRANALSYLIVLRLVPLFPFFIVNLVPALLGVPLWTFVGGTLIGIIPGSFVYASVGAGLGSVFDAGGTLSLQGVVTPQILTALIGLALLALIPVGYKRWTARRTLAG